MRKSTVKNLLEDIRIAARRNAIATDQLLSQDLDNALLNAIIAVELHWPARQPRKSQPRQPSQPRFAMDWRASGTDTITGWPALAARTGLQESTLRARLASGRPLHRAMPDAHGNMDAVTITRLA